MSKNVLSKKGKEKLFKALEEYIDERIELKLPYPHTKYSGDKAKKELKETILALEIETC